MGLSTRTRTAHSIRESCWVRLPVDQRVAATWDRKAVEVVPLASVLQAVIALPLVAKVIVPQFVEKVPHVAKAIILVPKAKAEAPVPMVPAIIQLHVAKAIVPVPMVPVIVPLLAVKAIVRLREEKGIVQLLVAKVPRVVKATVLVPMRKPVTVVPKVPPPEDASTQTNSGSNSTRTAMAASRRKKLPSG